MKKVIFLSRLFLLFQVIISNNVFAQNVSVEYKVRAGYLYNFTRFMSWPANDLALFNVCIVGKDPFGKIITPMETRTVKNKLIKVIVLNTLNQAKECQIIYSVQANTEIFSMPVLTVGESKQFVEQGGMIAFFLKDGKIKLYINLLVLRKSGLKISAKLLEVAEIYQEESSD